MLALHHTPKELVRQVRFELTIPCLRGRCLDPIWLPTHGGTERTRTVIGLVDNQVPHLSATVPGKDWGDLRSRTVISAFTVQRVNRLHQGHSKVLVASERLELSKVSVKN